jgi:DNA polymerase V
VTTDHYGRKVPKHAHGTVNFPAANSSTHQITDAFTSLFDRIADPALLVRRLTLTANHLLPETSAMQRCEFQQLDLFAPPEGTEKEDLAREKRRQKAVIGIKKKYGKNAIVRGMNLQEGATAMDRNRQIGGHRE